MPLLPTALVPRRPAPYAALVLLLSTALLPACAEAPTPEASTPEATAPEASETGRAGDAEAWAVVDSARDAAGAATLSSGARVSFGFRGDRYELRRRGDGAYTYTRTFRDSLGRRVEDVLTSAGALRRQVDGQATTLTDDEQRAAETTLNSVAYFALLPFPLGDAAVVARDAGADTVQGVPYHRVAVAFEEQGGGRDWQDRFLYWFDRRDFSMDYLAYAYGLGPDEAYGTRFRQAFNVRRPGEGGRTPGVRLADYRNYTALADSLPPGELARYGRLLEKDSLRQVSTVALDSARVEALPQP